MARWICRLLVLPLLGRMPMRLAEPLFLHQLQDSAGRHFLTRALRDARVIRQTGFVRRVTVEPFTAGQLSVTARVGLTYGDTEAETKRSAKGSHLGPPSLIIKMTRQDLIGKTVNMLVGLYRECHVYRDLLPLTDLPVPHCYYTSMATGLAHRALLFDGSYLDRYAVGCHPRSAAWPSALGWAYRTRSARRLARGVRRVAALDVLSRIRGRTCA